MVLSDSIMLKIVVMLVRLLLRRDVQKKDILLMHIRYSCREYYEYTAITQHNRK